MYKRQALEILTGKGDCRETVFHTADKIYETYGIKPVLSDQNDYRKREKEILGPAYGEDMVDKASEFGRKTAPAETDKACYQAMEAFVHNLNTMPVSYTHLDRDHSKHQRLNSQAAFRRTEDGCH